MAMMGELFHKILLIQRVFCIPRVLKYLFEIPCSYDEDVDQYEDEEPLEDVDDLEVLQLIV